MNSYLKIFLHGSAVSLLGAFLLGIVNYLIRRILCTNMSLVDYGIFYSTFSLFIMFFGFTDLGLTQSGTVMIAKANEKCQRDTVFSQLFFIKAFLALLCAVGFIIYYGSTDGRTNWIFILSFLGYFIFQVLNGTLKALWHGEKNYTISQVCYLLIALLTMSALFFLSEITLTSAVLCFLCPIAAVHISFLLFSHFRGLGTLHIAADKTVCRQLLTTGGVVAITTTLISVMYYIDTIMLNAIKGAESAGLYNIALPIMQIVQAAMVFPTVFLPIAVDMVNNGELAKLRTFVRYALLVAVLALLPTGLFFYYCSPWIISVLFKPEYIAAAAATTILCLGQIFFALGCFFFQVMLSLKKASIMAIIAAIATICNLLLNYILIIHFDINGAAAATLVSYLIFSILTYFAFERTVFCSRENKEKHYSFVLGKDIAFHFVDDPHLPNLLKKLHRSAAEVPANKSIPIQCCGFSPFASPLKQEKWNFYKGIPWKAAVQYDDSGAIKLIQFQAVIFRQFLFFRLVLLPLLWRQACTGGGFYTLGTAYRDARETTFLFARPGAGKTRYTLEKLLDPQYTLIGDGSLLYIPESGFIQVVDEIELRFKTVCATPYWSNLSAAERMKLFFLHFISVITGRYISFNLPLQSKKIGIELAQDSADTAHKFFIISDGNSVSVDAASAEKEIIAYLTDYHKCYRNIFKDHPPLQQTEENVRDFCKRYII